MNPGPCQEQPPLILIPMTSIVLVMDEYDDYSEYGQYEDDLETWETNQVYMDEWMEREEAASDEQSSDEGIEVEF